MLQDDFHQPVLLMEAINALIVNKRGNYVDCTLGGGGHSEEILNRLMKPGKLLCMDADPDAIKQVAQVGADRVELYTEPYATAFREKNDLDNIILPDSEEEIEDVEDLDE